MCSFLVSFHSLSDETPFDFFLTEVDWLKRIPALSSWAFALPWVRGPLGKDIFNLIFLGQFRSGFHRGFLFGGCKLGKVFNSDIFRVYTFRIFDHVNFLPLLLRNA
jgi:hypothetical protein